ncbi:hypothetical protein GCK32_018558 [Trichostrongylus colubriformis]|uniref:DUF7083 domain-containing protein n=1 Tax=Trichostrongylus colubriformis TaxID=6319 RepID=A0AAN8FRA9_TRICO
MDQSQLMAVFKEILEEQRRQHRELIQMLQHRVEDGDRVRTEDVTTPNVLAALSNRIEKFVFDADVEMGFSRWYSRYKEVFNEDARQLPEPAEVRLLCEKLDNVTYEKYQRHVLPRNVSDIGYQGTVDNLKHLFDFKTSEFTAKYQRLELEKNSDGIKCMLWIFGLKSQTEAEIRQRLIAILDREYRAGLDVTLLNENVWKKMGSPQLEKTNVTVKNASGDRMKVRGRLKCAVEMKGIKSVGYAYVTPYKTNTKSSSYVEELKRKSPKYSAKVLDCVPKRKLTSQYYVMPNPYSVRVAPLPTLPENPSKWNSIDSKRWE